jgi:hypothetical protein
VKMPEKKPKRRPERLLKFASMESKSAASAIPTQTRLTTVRMLSMSALRARSAASGVRGRSIVRGGRR